MALAIRPVEASDRDRLLVLSTRLTEGVAYLDNGRNLDTSVLPLPSADFSF